MIHLQVVICSVRQNRCCPAVAAWVAELAQRHGGFDVELVDLKAVNLPLFDEPHHPRRGNYMHEHTQRWAAIVARADAFLFVTPEYNHAAPAAIKNAIDYLHAEWHHKPVGFVSYGGVSGGTRAALSLRPVVSNLKMLPVAEAVAIPFFDRLIGPDGVFNPPPGLETSAIPMLESIAFYVERIGHQGRREPSRLQATGSD